MGVGGEGAPLASSWKCTKCCTRVHYWVMMLGTSWCRASSANIVNRRTKITEGFHLPAASLRRSGFDYLTPLQHPLHGLVGPVLQRGTGVDLTWFLLNLINLSIEWWVLFVSTNSITSQQPHLPRPLCSFRRRTEPYSDRPSICGHPLSDTVWMVERWIRDAKRPMREGKPGQCPA